MTEERVDQIRRMISENPHWHRTMLSQKLCELWDWRSENKSIKDISCRDVLRALDAAGAINLPAPLKKSRSGGGGDIITNLVHDTTQINCPLSQLTPLRVEIVAGKENIAVFKSYINQYHYLAYDRSIGESMKYAIYSRDGAPLGNLMFSSPAWACKPRDEYVGWDCVERRAGLRFTSNNSRFLIYPWVRSLNLASHILSLVCRRLPGDWTAKYGHPVFLVETFVERGRFRGTCYAASNWACVGKTTGRGRNDRQNKHALPEKDIYLKPLARRWRERLLAGQA